MKINSKIKKIVLIFIIIISLQQIIWAAPNISAYSEYEESPSRASARIIGAMIDLFQVNLLAVIILFIIVVLYLFISRLSKLLQVKRTINTTNLEKINLDNEIKNEILKSPSKALSNLYFLDILTKIIFMVSCIFVIVIASIIKLEKFLSIICIVLAYLVPVIILFKPLIKYVKKIEQIIKKVIYNKENLQNKEYYYAKEALRNIKRILPPAIIISILNYILIWLFEVPRHLA